MFGSYYSKFAKVDPRIDLVDCIITTQDLDEREDLIKRILLGRNFLVGDDIWDHSTISKYMGSRRMALDLGKAKPILTKYCKYVEQNYQVSSVRLLNSIVRMVRCHAGLLGRGEANEFDAMSMITIFECPGRASMFLDEDEFHEETSTMARVLNSVTY